MVLSYIAGPLIGAIIGYCTNYIAVKMLFYPRTEVKVFGHRLPFTPGVIPKGKDRLALAIADVVGNKLITKEDLKDKILNDKIGDQFAEHLMGVTDGKIKEKLREFSGMTEYEYLDKKDKITDSISNAIAEGVESAELADFIVQRGTQSIMESLNNPMIAMFLNGEMLESILRPASDKLIHMMVEEKDTLIRPYVWGYITEAEDRTMTDLLGEAAIDSADIKNMISRAVVTILDQNSDEMIAKLDLPSIVRDKVSAMSVEELEKLVLTVMKKELNAIVNLGALIGLIIGLLNLFL